MLKGVSRHAAPATVVDRSDGARRRLDRRSGSRYLLLLRDIPEHGGSPSFTVLLAVLAADTLAYFAGRLLGRHKLAPTISPGKTWEGFVAGTVAAVFVAVLRALRRSDFLTIGESLVLGAVIAVAAPLGDLFESALKRDMQVKDTGRCSAATAACSTASTRCSSPRSRRSTPSLGALQRRIRRRERGRTLRGDEDAIALLGATGSIGRQALEVVDAHPELELVAAASGSQPIDGLAPLTQVGGDLTELLERAEPDVVLNAVVGFAGLPATLWALERGVDLALANKESLVAAGELALAAQERGGGRLLPVDSEHSRRVPVPRGPRAEQVRLARAHRVGRAVPRPDARGARGRHARGGARAPDVEHGPEDHDRLGDAREQGARADRGALPLRPRRTTGSRSSSTRRRSSTRSCASATARRSRTSATRTCACRSRTR